MALFAEHRAILLSLRLRLIPGKYVLSPVLVLFLNVFFIAYSIWRYRLLFSVFRTFPISKPNILSEV